MEMNFNLFKCLITFLVLILVMGCTESRTYKRQHFVQMRDCFSHRVIADNHILVVYPDGGGAIEELYKENSPSTCREVK